MNRCKDCKYFQRNTSKYRSNKYGDCNCDKFIYGDSNDEKDLKKNDRLYYMDYEWYSASVEVGENFGCIHWEDK